MKKLSASIRKKLKPIRALLLDCDGIMTDAKVWYAGRGEWQRAYSLRDGYGLIKLSEKNIILGVITASQSEDIKQRVKSLKIKYFYHGRFNKINAYNDFKKKTGLKDFQIAYMGDDDPDIPILKAVGFAATVSDAMPAVLKIVDYVTTKSGGDGAVREVCEMILSDSVQGRN